MNNSIWEIILSIGGLGRLFANIAFVSALIATVALVFAFIRNPQEEKGWKQMGFAAFIVHGLAVLGIILTLFFMIYDHRYEYHYVWSHSSNELPVHFMISCFWEGQEGSFLLWTFWHVILGFILLATAKEWKTGVVLVIASVQVMLSSMLLGVWLSAEISQILLTLLTVILGLAVWRTDNGNLLSHHKLIAVFTSIIIGILIWKDQSGIGWVLTPAKIFKGAALEMLTALLIWAAVVGMLVFLISNFRKWSSEEPGRATPTIANTALWILFVVLLLTPVADWSIGSSPFLLLREAMPNAPVFQSDPGFIPSNGNGLNPLLQNYWMVIHPPTLFLGFASTLIPFAFMITGLLRNQYHEWIKPATPWNLFSALILGTGILMGGYWAYETLSFGGYWNWDPVENSSLVPWITGIASLHAFVAWNQKKSQLRFAYLLVALTFLLVLYSTFLTRSGILGEASVHSFTDLGLSGQLLVLLGVYFTGVLLIWFRKQKYIPLPKAEVTTGSREFYLFLAAAILLFAAIEIIFFTSSPVINKIFGLSIAPKNPLFYFKWNIWFSMTIAILSGIGQFFFWNKYEGNDLWKALYRPFALAVFSAIIILGLLIFNEWNFVYNETFRTELADIKLTQSTLMYYLHFVKYAIFFIADELLLISALFTVFANADVMIRLVRKHAGNIKLTGGSLAHLGFGFMLLGILFSSGYDSIISVNFKPGELGSMFPEDSRNDNVLLINNEPKYIKGYKVTYLGKKQAEKPLDNFAVLEWDDFSMKIKFTDAQSEDFSLMLPADVFLQDSSETKGNKRFNLEKIKTFTEENLLILKPGHLNERSLYGLQFESMIDSTFQFVLYPEAELNKSMGILAHPDRKVRWHEDIYVHVSSIPDPEGEENEMQTFELRMAKGDSAKTQNSLIILDNLVQVKDVPELAKYDFVAKAKLIVLHKGKEYAAEPIFIIDDKQPLSLSALVQEAGISFTFSGVDVDAGKVVITAEEISEPPDWVVFKAISKPWINLLWLGTFILTLGFMIAIWRRVS